MTSNDVRVAIGVPVRNEVDRLPRLLTALAGQQQSPGFTLCLFFDNCDDGSEELVACCAPSLPFSIVTDCCAAGKAPSAGLARKRAMNLALGQVPTGIVLTTDADSEPASDWIASNLEALRHADIVAGRVLPTQSETSGVQDRVSAYLDRLHRLRRVLDPVAWESSDTHHWTSSASLGFRAEVYRQLKGFPEIPYGEDAALADAAARNGYRMRRDATVMVRTSSRRTGRAQNGFAAALAAYDADPTLPQTVHPKDEAWRHTMQAAARRAFAAEEKGALANALGLPLDEVEEVAAECRNGEAFAARIVGAPPGGMRMVGLGYAEALLAGLEHVELVGAA